MIRGWSCNPSQFALQRHPALSKQKQGPAVPRGPPVPGGQMAGVRVCLERMNLFIKTKGANKQQSSQLLARLMAAETLLGH